MKYLIIIISFTILVGCNTTGIERGKLLSEQMELKENLHKKEIQIEEWSYSVNRNQALRNDSAFVSKLMQAKRDTTSINKRLEEIMEEIMYLDSIQFKK